MERTELLSIGEAADRSGFATSALRYYERVGLITSARTGGGQRRYERSVLRRLAFVRAARNVGLSLDEIAAALSTLPNGRAPNRRDWARLSRGWRARLDEQIAALNALRDGLDSCIGCGCLSLSTCSIQNPADTAGRFARGAVYLPAALRREGADPAKTGVPGVQPVSAGGPG